MSEGPRESKTEDGRARRLELQQAVLGVQRERVALTEAFMRFGVVQGVQSIETLMVRLLRLQRATKMAQGIHRRTSSRNLPGVEKPARLEEREAER